MWCHICLVERRLRIFLPLGDLPADLRDFYLVGIAGLVFLLGLRPLLLQVCLYEVEAAIGSGRE